MSGLNAKDYWQEKSSSYIDTMNSSYHFNSIEMITTLLADVTLNARVLDFGCGDGVMGEAVLVAGGSISCIDIDETMVSSTRERLSAFDDKKLSNRYSILCGGIEILSQYSEDEFDLILALNVLAYMSSEEEQKFYNEAQRILRPNGNLVVTHSNELFDLFTFNKYTVAFFRKHFSQYESMDNVASLLVHPNLPDREPLPIRENPLSYKYKLSSHGFKEVQQEFCILHPLPPLLMRDFDPDDLESRECLKTTNFSDDQKWKLMFMCSVFGSRSLCIKD